MNLYPYLLQAHSTMRYLILLVLIVALMRYTVGHITKRPFNSFDNTTGSLLLGLVHLQLILGIVLYFKSPIVTTALQDMSAAMQDDTLRFFAVEHATIMLAAVISITVGRVTSKRAKLDELKYRRALIGFSIGFVLIVAGIPWDKFISDVQNGTLFDFNLGGGML